MNTKVAGIFLHLEKGHRKHLEGRKTVPESDCLPRKWQQVPTGLPLEYTHHNSAFPHFRRKEGNF